MPCIGVGHSNTQSLDATSMQGILAEGSTTDIKHLLYYVFEKSKTADSESLVGKKLEWSFEALFVGKFPQTDDAGDRWPTGSSDHLLAGSDLAGGGVLSFI